MHLIPSPTITVCLDIKKTHQPIGNYFSIILTRHWGLAMTSFNHSSMTGFEDNEAISRDVMVIALFNIRYINDRMILRLSDCVEFSENSAVK